MLETKEFFRMNPDQLHDFITEVLPAAAHQAAHVLWDHITTLLKTKDQRCFNLDRRFHLTPGDTRLTFDPQPYWFPLIGPVSQTTAYRLDDVIRVLIFPRLANHYPLHRLHLARGQYYQLRHLYAGHDQLQLWFDPASPQIAALSSDTLAIRTDVGAIVHERCPLVV